MEEAEAWFMEEHAGETLISHHISHQPYTSHLSPYTLHLTYHTLHLTHYTSHITPYTSYLTYRTLQITPHTSNLTPRTLYLGELCVFYQLGWLDEAGNFNNVTAEADLAPLPSNVTEAVSQENMEQCMGMVLQEMSEDKMIKKCLEGDKYTEEELNKLEELAKGTAGIKCFVNMFQDGCNAFVGEKIYQGLYSSLDTVVAG